MPVSLIIALLVIGFVAIMLEAFIPAEGIVGVLGIICIIVSIVFAFLQSPLFGIFMLILGLIFGPASFALLFHLFPKTPVGKLLILNSSQEHDQGYTSFTPEKYSNLKGKEGIAVTTLRPSGMARIDNEKYSVVTVGDMIANGEKIKVAVVEGSRIVVRKA